MVPRSRRIWTFIAIALVLNLALSAILSRPEERMNVPYTFFRAQIEQGNVKEVTSQGDTIQGDFQRKTAYRPDRGDSPSDDQLRDRAPRPSATRPASS